MKLLNLDDIVLNSQRTIKYKGNDYSVRDFNVEEFIQFQKHFDRFRKAYEGKQEDDLQTVLDSTIELVKIGVPGFPHEEVKLFNPVQMLAVVSMIANLLPDVNEETAEAAAAGDEKKE